VVPTRRALRRSVHAPDLVRIRFVKWLLPERPESARAAL
jgi:hypothetical protein